VGWGEQTTDEMCIAFLSYTRDDEDLLKEGSPKPGSKPRRLGIELNERIVLSVTEGRPGHKAGLRAGDELVKLGGQEVEDWDDIRMALDACPAKTTLVVRRDGKEIELTIQFED
jgi:S1-C subfamily serine protease